LVDFQIAMPSKFSLKDSLIFSRLREETLKSLVHIVEKLDENQLQDKLVRCITSLQQDPENSIRTNATIFLGRIMPKLKESVRLVTSLHTLIDFRAKVLVPAYSKAMKDPFSHCRSDS
jgi:SCY1-like protein 1